MAWLSGGEGEGQDQVGRLDEPPNGAVSEEGGPEARIEEGGATVGIRRSISRGRERTPARAEDSPLPGAAGLQREARALGREFLDAFLRYEVGELDDGVRRALRRTTTTEFAGELLSSPPRAVGTSPVAPRGRLLARTLEVRLGEEAGTGVLSGVVVRAGKRETVSFIIERQPSGGLLVATAGER
ncbi:MAG: hypothetical protein ACR2K6_06620 [Solirubrobacterales bacterium]